MGLEEMVIKLLVRLSVCLSKTETTSPTVLHTLAGVDIMLCQMLPVTNCDLPHYSQWFWGERGGRLSPSNVFLGCGLQNGSVPVSLYGCWSLRGPEGQVGIRLQRARVCSTFFLFLLFPAFYFYLSAPHPSPWCALFFLAHPQHVTWLP